MNETNSVGLWTYSKNYLDAAKVVSSQPNGALSMPAFYLFGHSIELALKAFLRGTGYELNALRKISHDLERAFNEASERGLMDICQFDGEQIQTIFLLNLTYQNKEFEYIVTGNKVFPDMTVLETITVKLVTSLREFCAKSI